MRDHSSHGLGATGYPRESSVRTPRTDWRLGGRTTLRWRSGLLAVALISVGASIVLGAGLQLLWRSPWAATVATGLVMIGMAVPVVVALRGSRPAGLLRFRPADLLFGLGLGLLLRLVQGLLESAAGGSNALPSFTRIDGRLAPMWPLVEVAAPVVLAPVIEEFFFRGVLLVAFYALLRRPVGAPAAGAVAVLVSTAAFVLGHGLGGRLPVDVVATLALLGLVCSLLVMLTGRIWGAVLVHATFNASFVALALAGTSLA